MMDIQLAKKRPAVSEGVNERVEWYTQQGSNLQPPGS